MEPRQFGGKLFHEPDLCFTRLLLGPRSRELDRETSWRRQRRSGGRGHIPRVGKIYALGLGGNGRSRRLQIAVRIWCGRLRCRRHARR